jgi:outer membrane protein TolC
MSQDGDDLQDIEEIVRMAKALASAQEAERTRLRAAGVDVKHAEALLSAYREAYRVAAERHRRLLEWKSPNSSKVPRNISKR